MKPVLAFVAAVALVVGLPGCASYHPRPLALHADLASGVPNLDLRIPGDGRNRPATTIDPNQPLTIDQIGLLAVLNDPDLKSERGMLGVAQADLLQATLLPNPSANLGYGALISGPGTASSISASLAQDIAAIVTRGARVKSAEARLAQVDAEQLWREWQVAQKARQLAVDIDAEDRTIRLTRGEHQLLLHEVAAVKSAIAKGNLTIAALAPLLTAVAAAEKSLQTLQLTRQTNWQALDALLGLLPSARFAIAHPTFSPLPTDLGPLVADLPQRRPDLAALRLGYASAEEDVRAAILGQFPAFSIGPSYSSDTSKVVTVGPSFTFTLPIFDRNQGNIAKARATRMLLRQQYQARLDRAVANIHALTAQLDQLSAALASARQAAVDATSFARTARGAYAQGNIDERTLTDYETTALEREVEAADIERRIAEDRIFLTVELGLDLPRMRIALSSRARR